MANAFGTPSRVLNLPGKGPKAAPKAPFRSITGKPAGFATTPGKPAGLQPFAPTAAPGKLGVQGVPPTSTQPNPYGPPAGAKPPGAAPGAAAAPAGPDPRDAT